MKTFLFLLLFVTGLTVAQGEEQKDFSEVDNAGRSIKYKDDLKLLVSDLTKGYTSEPNKARAIFVWIADNIEYDVKMFNSGKRNAFKCKGDNCKSEYIKWEDELVGRTLRKGKGVCEGYARLFKRMCDYAGIRCDVVAGYIKDNPSEIGKMGTLDHAWNGIILNGEYYYLDVTWGAGGCSRDEKGKLEKFHKHFDNYYWLTPVDKLFRDHFPADEKLPHIMADSRQKFKDTPFIPQFYQKNVTVKLPNTGVLEVHAGDTIHFEIEIKDILWSTVDVFSNVDRVPQRVGDDFEEWREQFNKHPDTHYIKEGNTFKFDT